MARKKKIVQKLRVKTNSVHLRQKGNQKNGRKSGDEKTTLRGGGSLTKKKSRIPQDQKNVHRQPVSKDAVAESKRKKRPLDVTETPLVAKTADQTSRQSKAKEKKADVFTEEKERKQDLGLTPMRIYLNQIDAIPLLTPDEEYDLSRKVKCKLIGWKDAREKMIKCNLRLVINIAKRYANIGLSFSDLVEEGNIGLMKAVDKFDYEKGYRFSTYASWWIKQGMMRALSNQSKMIRIPVHMYESITKWRKSRELFIQRYGKIPTRKDLARQMKVTPEKIKEIEGVLNNPASLNVPVSLESSSELIDIIEDKNSEKPYESSHELLKSQRIEQLLNLVSGREKRILVLRFGLMGEEPRTLEETAQEFGVTRERIRQIEEAALKKIGAEAKKQDDRIDNYL